MYSLGEKNKITLSKLQNLPNLFMSNLVILSTATHYDAVSTNWFKFLVSVIPVVRAF